MPRILFLVIFLLYGNSVFGQTENANNVLEKLITDPENRVAYLHQLQKEFTTLTEEDLLVRLSKTAKVIDKNFNVSEQVSAYRILGKVCWSKSLYAESLNYYDKSIQKADAAGTAAEAGIVHMEVAHLFMDREMYPQALERVYKANEYFLQKDDKLNLAKARSMAAAIGYRATNYILAVEEIERSLSLFRAMDTAAFSRSDSVEMMSALNTCGLANGKIRRTEKAMACYAEAEKLALLLRDQFWIGLINGNKAQIYAQRNEIEMAISSLHIDLRSSLASRQWSSALGSSISLTELFIRKKEWPRAKQYLDTANQLIKRYGTTPSQKARYFENFSKILAHAKKDGEAYRALLRHSQIRDSLERQRQAAALTRIKTAYDIQQKQSQIELLTLQNRTQAQQAAYRNSIVGGATVTIILLFILAVVIYRNYKQKKADNYLLIERNNDIKAINEELRSYAETLSSQNETIQKLNNDLEQNVKRRTHELEEANTELDMFLYRASHDIRRPITTLLGLGNLAHVSFFDQNAVQLFDKVTETATHMDRMLHKLQMVYALNRPLGTSTQVLLIQAIHNSIDKFSREMKKIEMDCVINYDEPPSFKGDESLLSIIFQNLIENAITFRKSDELEKPHLWMEITQREGYIAVQVRDNGIGIESDYIDKVFDLHFRGTTLSHGNGLGLYLVKKALTLLKGRIEVTSEYGIGSTFTLYFYLQ